MWRYLEGSKPPLTKKAKTHEEQLEVGREYDRNKRERRFQAAWTKDFPWLLHDETNKKLYCRPCRSSYGELSISKLPDRGIFRKYSKGAFVVGSTNFKSSALADHQQSEGHTLAVTHIRNRGATPGKSIAEKSIQQLNNSAFDKLEKLFRTAHALARKNRPFSDFGWLCTLDEKKEHRLERHIAMTSLVKCL